MPDIMFKINSVDNYSFSYHLFSGTNKGGRNKLSYLVFLVKCSLTNHILKPAI